MIPDTQKKKTTSGSISDSIVHIAGSNKLQNELLVLFLESKAGLKCTYGSKLSLDSVIDNEACQTRLLMLDCFGADLDDLWSRFEIAGNSNLSRFFIALFNIEPDKGFERDAMDRGVRGVFCNTVPLNIFSKGITAILNGELWYSRDTLSKYLLEQRRPADLPGKNAVALTFREKEILIMIASGAGNKEIADDLCISLHTVKTHIYNIYKKINVPNRFQATLWAAKYL